jgi:hypothetical protein
MARKSQLELNIIAEIKELEDKIQFQVDRAEIAREMITTAEGQIELFQGSLQQLQSLLALKTKKVKTQEPGLAPARKRSAEAQDPYSL